MKLQVAFRTSNRGFLLGDDTKNEQHQIPKKIQQTRPSPFAKMGDADFDPNGKNILQQVNWLAIHQFSTPQKTHGSLALNPFFRFFFPDESQSSI